MKKRSEKVNKFIFFIKILLAIKEIFPKSTNFICSWHVQQNLKKKYSYLNRSKNKESKDLYQRIIQLPFSNDPEEFETSFAKILGQNQLQSDMKIYLLNKAKEKEFWVKGFMKKKFCCGMCSSSRIESKHRVLKQYLNSSKRLTELFQVLKNLEAIEISRMENKIEKSRKNERKKKEKMDIIVSLKEIYSDYVLERVKDNLLDSINYKIDKQEKNLWYCLFLSLA